MKNVDKNKDELKFNFCELYSQILSYSDWKLTKTEYLQELSEIIINFLKCDEVEIWTEEETNYYKSTVKRIPTKHYNFEVLPKKLIDKLETFSYLKSCEKFEDLCIGIINNAFVDLLPVFKRNGIAWIYDKYNFKKSIKSDNKIAGFIKDSHLAGFKSFAIIPFNVKNNNGIVILKNRKRTFFKDEDINNYEIIANSLGIVLANRDAHWALGERIKELTCLYGISKLVEQPNISLDKILQIVADMLPPAWQYPEITSSRIVFDGKVFVSHVFQDGIHKQSSEIVINGKIRGGVDVIYSKNVPEQFEGPFLKEERNLIDAVSKELALIIERRKSEEERTELQDQLRHADRLATIGQLAAGIAHELNEPIGNMLGFAQLAKKHPDITKQIENDIGKIEKASLHAREIVKKLLLFARQVPSQKKRLNLNEIIENSLFFYEHRCQKEGINLEKILVPDLPEIEGDPSQLSQAFVNMVVNSIQAMPDGGKISIQTSFNEECVFLFVEDNGIGMNEDTKNKIFLPFFTTKDVSEGTGLGLPVVHGIVMSHNGKINVFSEENKGTIFEIKFPYKK